MSMDAKAVADALNKGSEVRNYTRIFTPPRYFGLRRWRYSDFQLIVTLDKFMLNYVQWPLEWLLLLQL